MFRLLYSEALDIRREFYTRNFMEMYIRQKCKTKLRPYLGASKVLSEDLTHNHEVNTRKTERKILRVNAKRKAQEELPKFHPVHIFFHLLHWYVFSRPIELWIRPNVNQPIESSSNLLYIWTFYQSDFFLIELTFNAVIFEKYVASRHWV